MKITVLFIAGLITFSSCSFAQGNASGGYDFSTYTSISANSNAIIGSVQANGYQLMPIGGPALPDSLIQKITCWINQGKLDN